jgi:hypothetical protein
LPSFWLLRRWPQSKGPVSFSSSRVSVVRTGSCSTRARYDQMVVSLRSSVNRQKCNPSSPSWRACMRHLHSFRVRAWLRVSLKNNDNRTRRSLSVGLFVLAPYTHLAMIWGDKTILVINACSSTAAVLYFTLVCTFIQLCWPTRYGRTDRFCEVASILMWTSVWSCWPAFLISLAGAELFKAACYTLRSEIIATARSCLCP